MTERGEGKCKREDREMKGSGLRQIKSYLTEVQHIIQAKCYHCYSSLSPFHSSLTFSLVAASVKHDIRLNDSNTLLSELAAGFFLCIPLPLSSMCHLEEIHQSLQ